MKKNASSLLEVTHLTKHFPIKKGVFKKIVGHVKAVDEISFSINAGEIVGMVGESGSGKSTAGRSAIRLIEPTSGTISFMGQDLSTFNKNDLRHLRKNIQMIFQDPLASLNPRKTVLENIGGALLYHKFVTNREEQVKRVFEILKTIGMPLSSINQYPHQFSGGQQQRISIGRAIAMQPKLMICDEAVSALDLSVQAQILNLLFELKERFSLSYLFISHDLSVVRNFCDTVLVLFEGKIVERGPARTIFDTPKHPYTRALLSAIPKSHPKEQKQPFPLPISSGAPTPFGCPYYSRCALAKPECAHHFPATKHGHDPGHEYSCLY